MTADSISDPTEDAAAAQDAAAAINAASAPPVLGWEITAVICLAVLPDAINAAGQFFGAYAGSPMSFAYMTASLISRSLQASLPVMIIVYYRSGSLRELGLGDRPRTRDALIAVALFVSGTIAMYAAIYPLYYATWFLLGEAGLAWWNTPAGSEFPGITSGIDVLILLPLLSAANGFAEELVMRGYLIPRVEAITHSSIAAVLITSFAFASYHLYQGLGGVVGTAALGIVYGAVFCWTRRLWPLALAHALADFFLYLWAAMGWTT